MYSIPILVVAAFASIASAYTTPVGNPSGNPISRPGLNEIVPVGAPYTITWNPTTPGTVTLVLLRGPSSNILPLYPIVQNTTNSGTYSWTPSTSLQADTTHYGIQLIVDATGQYQYSTQFGISNLNPVTSASSSSSTSPSSSFSSLYPSSSSSPSTSSSSPSTSSSSPLSSSSSSAVSTSSQIGIISKASTITITSTTSTPSSSATVLTSVVVVGNSTITMATIPTTFGSATASPTQASPSGTPAVANTAAAGMAKGCGAIMLSLGGLVWALI